MNNKLLSFKKNKLWYAVYTSSLAITWLTAASVVQASDLQIYAKPEGGQTTVILMLDNSMSMKDTDTGVSGTRLARLQSGVRNLLNQDTVTLTNGTVVNLKDAVVGLGYFSNSTNNRHGIIQVPAAALGNASTLTTAGSQRAKLLSAVNAMNGNSATPSAHAMAEAAAYLLGTTTYWEKEVPVTVSIDVEKYKLIRRYTVGTKSGSNYPYTYTYKVAQCTSLNSINFTTRTQTCSYWGDFGSPTTGASSNSKNNRPNWNKQPTNIGTAFNPTNPSDPSVDTDQTITYSVAEDHDTTELVTANTASSYTGITGLISGIPLAKSSSYKDELLVSSTANDINLRYKSPLPTNSVSCDGQGIYFLSDGRPNDVTVKSAESVMQAALADDTFTCPVSDSDIAFSNSDLPNPDGDYARFKSGWNCMGALAKRLYSSDNPKARSINTAFVGFGGTFASMTADSDDARAAKYACKLGSKLAGDTCSPDATNTTLKNPSGGFGNGGFYYVTTDTQVTQSIANFIKDNQKGVVAPLATGQISVPYDALNPNTLQEYGYLRALEPNPASTNVTWNGNLKKYQVVLSGTTAGAFTASSGGLVFDSTGKFRTGTKDYWNASGYADGGITWLGGAYSKVPLPILGQTEQADATGKITRYAYTASNNIRNLFTDVSAATTTTLTKMSVKNSSLLKLPEAPAEGANPFTSAASTASYVLGKFNVSGGQNILKDFPTAIKLKILNYLGYKTDTSASVLPTALTTENSPYLSMGGSVHSLPVQLTYSGSLDANGNLTTTRDQSIMYGSSEGGLHIVNASTGQEQMVFVPADILEDTLASKGLVAGSIDSGTVPTHGVDGAWVADSAYDMSTSTANSTTTTNVKARKMNVYGGLRMGGSSYYGLDVLTPTSPKFLFRIHSGLSDYSRLGQTWSKPVLANIRHNGTIKRVMIVGGGYDTCYENPNFQLNTSVVSNTDYPDTSCNSKTQAQGNAVYIIDASDGSLVWSATYNSSATVTDGRKYMTHSIVSRISTLDRNADGLVDHLYFGDLGGQVFRIDLNNNQTLTGSTYSDFGVRVVRLANLATNDTTSDSGNDYTGSKAPRFYEPPTVTIHDEGKDTFIALGIASGDRSTPLDVSPTGTAGRDNMKPSTALTDRPVNNVYGVIDKDFIKKNLISGTPTLVSINKVRTDFKKNPQILATGEKVVDFFFPSTGAGKDGWYRSLSSTDAGVEKAGTSQIRVKGGLKAFEEPMAITGNLLVSVYDPEGTGVGSNIPCMPRVVGETDWQTFCLPFGACLNSDGTINSTKEGNTGFKVDTDNKNKNIIGPGIRSIAFVPKADSTGSSSTTNCGKITMAGNTSGSGEWQCTSHFIPTRWYERYR